MSFSVWFWGPDTVCWKPCLCKGCLNKTFNFDHFTGSSPVLVLQDCGGGHAVYYKRNSKLFHVHNVTGKNVELYSSMKSWFSMLFTVLYFHTSYLWKCAIFRETRDYIIVLFLCYSTLAVLHLVLHQLMCVRLEHWTAPGHGLNIYQGHFVGEPFYYSENGEAFSQYGNGLDSLCHCFAPFLLVFW